MALNDHSPRRALPALAVPVRWIQGHFEERKVYGNCMANLPCVRRVGKGWTEGSTGENADTLGGRDSEVNFILWRS